MDLIGSDPLTVFQQQAVTRPFQFGVHDCLLFLADWIVAQGGEDPAEEYRGQYSSESEANRIIAKAGGMVALISGQVGKEHLTDTPQRGDIGVIETPRGKIGAIVLDGGTVALGPHPTRPHEQSSLLRSRNSEVPILTAWRV